MAELFRPAGLILIAVILVSIVARKMRLPYTVGLVTAGIGLSFIPEALVPFSLSKELIFSVFLPPLIFEAAFYIRWSELRKDLASVLTLAALGTIVSSILIGVLTHLLLGWSWNLSLLFGTIICATDPVAVIATFKDTGVKGRLRLIVEAESLINDGAAAILFGLALSLMGGVAPTAATVAVTFLREVAGGLLIGFGVGYGVLLILQATEDHLVEITLTAVAAYGSFLMADSIHASGVLSTLACGLVLGNLGEDGAIAGTDAVHSFWDFAAFLVNSLIFILIGKELSSLNMSQFLTSIAIGFFIITVVRAAVVYSMSSLFRGGEGAIPIPFQHILFWGGLRGALSLALVLGLPSVTEGYSQIVPVVFGVVVASIILQGITMPSVLRRFRII